MIFVVLFWNLAAILLTGRVCRASMQCFSFSFLRPSPSTPSATYGAVRLSTSRVQPSCERRHSLSLSLSLFPFSVAYTGQKKRCGTVEEFLFGPKKIETTCFSNERKETYFQNQSTFPTMMTLKTEIMRALDDLSSQRRNLITAGPDDATREMERCDILPIGRHFTSPADGRLPSATRRSSDAKLASDEVTYFGFNSITFSQLAGCCSTPSSVFHQGYTTFRAISLDFYAF